MNPLLIRAFIFERTSRDARIDDARVNLL